MVSRMQHLASHWHLMLYMKNLFRSYTQVSATKKYTLYVAAEHFLLSWHLCSFLWIHLGNGHWVTVSTVGCKDGKIDIFDSGSPHLNEALQRQIAVLLCTKRDIVEFGMYWFCLQGWFFTLLDYAGTSSVKDRLGQLTVVCLLLHLQLFLLKVPTLEAISSIRS